MSWPQLWKEITWKNRVLAPLSNLVCREASRRFQKFQSAPPSFTSKAKVIVVGNIVVGGTGKTPFIVWLVKQLQQQGLKVGIISRGYGGKNKQWPKEVKADSQPAEVGDEPVLLAKQLECPIAVSPMRTQAISLLESNYDLDVIVSDDGLQHYKMPRDIEIVLIDGQRGFGNGLCLPGGPLREPITKLQHVNYLVVNGDADQALLSQLKPFQAITYSMQLEPLVFRNVAAPKQTMPVDGFAGQTVSALAGIGNPQRFFETLKALNLTAQTKAFPDHHAYQLTDFSEFDSEKPLIMTEKDAVKCHAIAEKHQFTDWWYLEVTPQCEDELAQQILKTLAC